MVRRPKSSTERFFRAALRRGANPLMRRAAFVRPGGGWTWSRERPWTGATLRREQLQVSMLFPYGGGPYGWVQLWLSLCGVPHPRGTTVPISVFEHRLPLDVEGDAMDLAVSIEHWLRSEGLPWFERAPDLVTLAREAEARDERRDCWAQWEVPRIASLWRLAGRPDEAERVERVGRAASHARASESRTA